MEIIAKIETKENIPKLNKVTIPIMKVHNMKPLNADDLNNNELIVPSSSKKKIVFSTKLS